MARGTMDFLAELKRRNVIRVGVAYAAVSGLVLQADALVFGALELPNAVLLTDIFKVQDEIATAVVAALKPKLLTAPLLAESARQTANIEAYHQYLPGKQSFLRTNLDGWRKAEAAYKQEQLADGYDRSHRSALQNGGIGKRWDSSPNAHAAS